MPTDLFLLTSMVLGTLTYGLWAKWFVMPKVRAGGAITIVSLILLFHSLRHLGLAFLIPGVTAEPLDLRFANPAAYGDLLAAILAFVALAAVRQRSSLAVPALWLFNLVGFVDLIYAPIQGLIHVPNEHFGATYFIPVLIVPFLWVTHGVIFVVLAKYRRQLTGDFISVAASADNDRIAAAR